MNRPRIASGFAAAVSGFALLALVGCETTSAWEEGTPSRCRVRTGSADLLCQVSADGAVSDCRVVSERPADCGFGDAALEAAKSARLNSTGRDGGGQPGDVTFTVRFDTSRGRHP